MQNLLRVYIMETSLVQSINGKDLLEMNNFTFFKQKVLKNGETFWRCTKRSTKCTAKVFTRGSENLVVRSELFHNHEANVVKLNRQRISTACKRKAEENISEKPSKIIRCELEKNLAETVTVTDINYVRRNLYNARRKILPGPLPRSASEVHEAVEKFSAKTCKGEDFVFINNSVDNVIVFSTESNIRALCDMCCIYMDGTFSYCAKYFKQLFTIHGLKNGHYIPLAFCLLRDKQTTTYKNLFSSLIDEVSKRYGILFQPSEVFVDFEMAIHKAILESWPTTKLNGCRFHLHQTWFRKIQALGLAKEFSDQNSQVGRWLRYTFGLTFLNPNEVGDCFAFDLYSEKPNHEVLDKYADYLLETYVGEDAIFPPFLWAKASPALTYTTNACESFHSRFNGSFYATHPSIYIFIKKLLEFQIDTYVKLQSVNIQNKIKDKHSNQKLETIIDLQSRLNSGEITRFHFVKCVSYYAST